MLCRTSFIALALSLCSLGLWGQETTGYDGFSVPEDTVGNGDVPAVPTVKAHLFAGKPGRAALYSLILPGAGQFYNKKYWQVPIAMAGVGVAGAIMLNNRKFYRGYNGAYREYLQAELENREPVIADAYKQYTQNQLLNLRNQWNQYRQLSIIAFAATWIANSAQAYVSAQLKDFDISDDLSLNLVPLSISEPGFPMVPVAPALVLQF